MKKPYIVSYKCGLMGKSVVFASDRVEAIKEAIAFCRFRSMNIPEEFGPKDIIESITEAPNTIKINDYQTRPVVEKMTSV